MGLASIESNRLRMSQLLSQAKERIRLKRKKRKSRSPKVSSSLEGIPKRAKRARTMMEMRVREVSMRLSNIKIYISSETSITSLKKNSIHCTLTVYLRRSTRGCQRFSRPSWAARNTTTIPSRSVLIR